VRADFRPRQGHRVAEVAPIDLCAKRRRVGRSCVHGYVRDLPRQIDLHVDNVRELFDRTHEIVLAAGAEHVFERDLKRVGIRPVFTDPVFSGNGHLP